MKTSAPKLLDPDLLDPEQAAQYLRLKSQTLAVWRVTGRYNLPFVRCGRLIRYKPEDLDAWLESRRQTHTGQAVSQ